MYLLDENISRHLVEFMKHLGVEASHVESAYGLGILDVEFLPLIKDSDTILVTVDYNMKSFSGKDGHGAILRENNIKALFLPKSFLRRPIGIPESAYPSIGWAQCLWILRYWHEIDTQVSQMKNLSLAQSNDRGKVERI